MITTRGHLSSETIDLLLLSALAASEANQAKEHIDSCDRCRTRWRELNEDKQRFEQFVFARTLPKIEEKLSKQGFVSRFLGIRWLIPAVGLAAAAGIVAVVSLTGPGTQTEDEAYIGVKGAPSFEVFAQRNEGSSFPVKAGSALKAGDRIRFVVNPAGSRFVLVASQDGKGAFSVYHPFGATESKALESQMPRRQELPGSVELDDTLGKEKLVVVLSDAPVKASEVEAALKANPDSPKVPGARVISWDFVKEAR